MGYYRHWTGDIVVPKSVGEAPGKVILSGEHAVVYGRPAIAVPVWETMARATVEDTPNRAGCEIYLRDVQRLIRLAEAAEDDPVAVVVRKTLAHLCLAPEPNWRIEATSQIPMASGLGSGAALSAAIARAIFRHAHRVAEPAMISELVYASEKLYHGTPSGIDNTVVAYETPVWFVRGEPPQWFRAGAPIQLVIADSGVPSPTKATVGAVREKWKVQREQYEQLFDVIAGIVASVRDAMVHGSMETLGRLFDENHRLLQSLGVSTPRLDQLVQAARGAGALGAKLSGGGGGGNMIALVSADSRDAVSRALTEAGAARVLVTVVGTESE